jgi:hypothetical protein
MVINDCTDEVKGLREVYGEILREKYSKTFKEASEDDIWEYIEEVADIIQRKVQEHGIKAVNPIKEFGRRLEFIDGAGLYDVYHYGHILVAIVEEKYQLWAKFSITVDRPKVVNLIDLYLWRR